MRPATRDPLGSCTPQDLSDAIAVQTIKENRR